MSQGAKRLFLTIVSLIFLIIFFNVPFYREWLRMRVIEPLQDISEQAGYMEIEQRKEMRYGSTYVVSKNIANYLLTQNDAPKDSTIVLLPPKKFITDNKCDFAVPEPVVFYYFSGLKSKLFDSPGAEQSNYAVVCKNSNIQLVKIVKGQAEEAIKFYSQYK